MLFAHTGATHFQPRFYLGGPVRFYLPLYYDLVAATRPRLIVTAGYGDGQAHHAFCQAVREQGLACRCTATPSPGAGDPADDPDWQSGVARAQEWFGEISEFVSDQPAEAAQRFPDGSVDMLLIDDCDSRAEGEAQFNAWHPKLSSTAVVMIHGLQTERADPIAHLWKTISAGQLHAELPLGLGLGIIAAGPNALLDHLSGPPEKQRELLVRYEQAAARIDAHARAAKAEEENTALRLRQVWLDFLLEDRWKAQGVMDEQRRDLETLQHRFDALKQDRDEAQHILETRFTDAKAQLIIAAQQEQLRDWAVAIEKTKAELAAVKAQLEVSRARKKRSVPERIFRELRRVLRRVGVGAGPVAQSTEELRDRYADWVAEHEPDAAALQEQRRAASGLTSRPKFSLLLPIYNTPARFLEELLASLAAQTYPEWEACIVDAGLADPASQQTLARWLQAEPRLRHTRLTANLGIAENTNRALEMATGDFITCVDHDDVLAPFALFELARAISANPAADMFYSDEDRLRADGKRHEPFFKPEWSVEYLLSSMYLGHLTVYRRDLVARVGQFRREFDLSQDYDFALRASEQAAAIGHVPHVLYHWREHAGSASAGGKPEARQTNLAALAAAMERRGLAAEIIEYPTANRARLKVPVWPKVSIVVPTDSAERARQCLEELPRATEYPDLEIVIVTNSRLVELLRSVTPENATACLVPYDLPFNFSEKCNLGARAASGARLIFFNDDVASAQPDWVQNLIEPLENPAIGAVSPKLLYETGRIQHAGLVMGVRGLVGTACHQWPADSIDHANFAQSMRNVSALSGACLAMRTEDFFAVGEYDAVNTPIAHSDLDLCFKLRERGLRCVYTPFVTMLHRGHVSIGAAEQEERKPPRDKANVFLLKRWTGYTCHDPFFPENMRDWLYADSPTPIRMWGSGQAQRERSRADLLFVSHDLSWSGAPLILFHLAKWCKAQGFFVTAMSPQDGPLRAKFCEAGIPLVVDPLVTKGDASFPQLAREFDCVIASTIFGAPIVEAAQAEGIPHVWWIHEGRVAEHYLEKDPAMRRALGLADLIITPDTRSAQIYQPFANHPIQVLHYGIPDPAEGMPAESARETEVVKFLLLGTIEHRKGQRVFLEALRQLPDDVLPRARFRIVGRPHDLAVVAEIKAAVGECAALTFDESVSHEEALALIRATDVMVSASWDETGPLILMEALALGRPILSTTVGAVAELLQGKGAGLFFPAGNASALAEAITRLVREPELLERMRGEARGAYEKHFDFERFAEAFLKLARV